LLVIAFGRVRSTFLENAMQLNHLDLPVPDVRATADFFIRFFGFKLDAVKGNDGMAILKGDGGVVLVLTRRSDDSPAFAKTFHVGFLVPSPQEVPGVHRQLSEGGCTDLSPVSSMRGSTLLYCHAPGGVLVEVGHRPDA
jgi:catechol 2,3-dioxygenase-like lactoylglutathione lyase family enzyme